MTTDFRQIAQRLRPLRPPIGKARPAGADRAAFERTASEDELGKTFLRGDPLAGRLEGLRKALERPDLPPALTDLAEELADELAKALRREPD